MYVQTTQQLDIILFFSISGIFTFSFNKAVVIFEGPVIDFIANVKACLTLVLENLYQDYGYVVTTRVEY